MEQANVRLFSTSSIHGSGYLEYCQDAVKELFAHSENILFIPYARPGGIGYDEYTDLATSRFSAMGLHLSGIHREDEAKRAVEKADGIFIGGGNSFLLLKTLYDLQLIDIIRKVVLKGVPYMGSSAGSNVAGLTISTTNDMPIVYPPGFNALGIVPFNLNPHYLDPDPNSTHKGETRETRIKEFHMFNNQPVVGLREGSWLKYKAGRLSLEGALYARIFRQGIPPEEVTAGSDLNFLLT